jgi:hypothetical protein
MEDRCKNEIQNLIRIIHMYIGDCFIKYEEKNNSKPKYIYEYNNEIRIKLEDDNFTRWLYERGVDCVKILDTELSQYIIEQMDDKNIFLQCLPKNVSCDTLKFYDIVNIFARYEAEKTLIIKDD